MYRLVYILRIINQSVHIIAAAQSPTLSCLAVLSAYALLIASYPHLGLKYISYPLLQPARSYCTPLYLTQYLCGHISLHRQPARVIEPLVRPQGQSFQREHVHIGIIGQTDGYTRTQVYRKSIDRKSNRAGMYFNYYSNPPIQPINRSLFS